MRKVRYSVEYKATYEAEMGIPENVKPEHELEYIQENLISKTVETGQVPIDFDNPPKVCTLKPIEILGDTKGGVLSAEDRWQYEKRLQEVNDLLATANIEWYPKQTEIFELEREKEELEATLQYDDYSWEEKDEEFEMG